MADPHGGDDHFFTRELKCSSTNKIISIEIYGRAYPQKGRGCNMSGEGNATVKLDTTTVYPCHNKTYYGKFPAYSPNATIVVNLRPLSSVSTLLNVTAQWYNNYNQDIPTQECTDYPFPINVSPDKWNLFSHLVVTSKDGVASSLYDGELPYYNGGMSVTAQGEKWYADISEIASIRLTSTSTIPVSGSAEGGVARCGQIRPARKPRST
jgi:hypothetical protein